MTGNRAWGAQTLNDTLVFVKKDSSDILAHLERDMLEKRSTVALLSEKVDALTVELEATLTRIAELEKVRPRPARSAPWVSWGLRQPVAANRKLWCLFAGMCVRAHRAFWKESHARRSLS